MATKQTYTTYAQAAPDYQGKPVLIDLFPQSPIHIGTFVVFKDDSGKESIGRIVRAITNEKSLTINDFEINIFRVVNPDDDDIHFNIKKQKVEAH